MLVVDTNVVSELGKARSGKADKRVVAWAGTVTPGALFISAITVLELELGVSLAERRDAVQGELLRAWLDGQVLPACAGRILDVAVARRCAALHMPDRRSDRDALIAATALIHAMTVVTRNVADYTPTGVAVLDPWSLEP